VRLDLDSQGADVVRACPLVGVGQVGEGTGGLRDGVVPGGEGCPAGGDGGKGGAEQVRVVEQQQMSVEDRRRALPCPRSRELPRAAHVPLDGYERRAQPRLLGSGIGGGMAQDLTRLLAPLARTGSPFSEPVPRPDAVGAHWVEPRLLVEVAHLGLGGQGRLRQPSVKGLRTDLRPDDVGCEPAP
jgi:hypothetical protein